ncbi:MAG TPA: TIGR04013 family B12-binding domain/radical SAM domain-containing protein [Anaeromyxobacter sp.]|nr:TIGR04013 family B12-binding domain/radical SAM domain-containing protein [Anaeromyxobacter sp.]
MPATLVLHDRPTSRFAMNALLGAVECDPRTRDLPAAVARSAEAVAAAARDALAAGRRPLVGWSFYSASFAQVAAELARVRAAAPDARVVHLAGGAHASAAPEETLRAGFDLVAVGEGEETLPAVLGAVDAGGDARGVPGLAWLEDGALRTSGRARPVELDRFPPCAPRGGRFGPIEITRGCVWGCRFCQTPFRFKARFRHRSLEEIVRWVRAGSEAGKDVRFVTPSGLSWGSAGAGCDLAAVEALLARVREAAGPRRKVILGAFPSELRPEHVTARALAVLRRWCDNRQVILGGQSGSDRMLAAMGRGHDAATVTRAAALALEAGFRPSVDFVFGLPGEEEEDREATRTQLALLARMGARVHVHAFDPLPGTPWAREPRGGIDPRTAALLSRLGESGRAYGEMSHV